MKLKFAPPTDGKVHSYCINCQAESPRRTEHGNKLAYTCDACGQTNPRSIYFDNRRYRLADDGELWHASAGVFVRNRAGKFLFFERTMFPIGLTIPAGHVDQGEEADTAAVRELDEEVGINTDKPRLAVTTDIVGDSCSSGADAHTWYVYVVDYTGDEDVEVQEEGQNPIWLTLDEATAHKMPFAIRYLLEHHKDALANA